MWNNAQAVQPMCVDVIQRLNREAVLQGLPRAMKALVWACVSMKKPYHPGVMS